jgi:hypothetical protein
MKVWVVSTKARAHVKFHRELDCTSLQGGIKQQRTKGRTGVPPFEVELEGLSKSIDPCMRCFPDQPRANVSRLRCQICPGQGRVYPCEHNGGVLVTCMRRGAWKSVDGERVWDPKAYSKVVRHVWPENAHKFDLVRT